MTDPRVAYNILESAKQRVLATGEDLGESTAYYTAYYLMFRLGVNSIDEFNSEVDSITVEEQTEEAFNQ